MQKILCGIWYNFRVKNQRVFSGCKCKLEGRGWWIWASRVDGEESRLCCADATASWREVAGEWGSRDDVLCRKESKTVPSNFLLSAVKHKRLFNFQSHVAVTVKSIYQDIRSNFCRLLKRDAEERWSFCGPFPSFKRFPNSPALNIYPKKGKVIHVPCFLFSSLLMVVPNKPLSIVWT